MKLVYPENLDFSKDESLIIRYIIPQPSLIKNIKIKKDSSNIECYNLNEMKLCKVSFAHFRNEYISGYYNTLCSNNEINFTIFYDSPKIYVNLPEINKINFAINEINNNKIIYTGVNNILYLVTNFNDSISNIFTPFYYNRFSFKTTFSNDKNNKLINGKCDIWQPENENVRLICKLEETFDYGKQNISLNDYIINYNNNKLLFYTDSKNITVKQIFTNISVLYSDKQEININDKINSYELKFKKVSYHNEHLVLYKNKYQKIYLNCNDKNTDVICNINKDSVIKILSFSGEKFHVSQLINSEGMLNLNSIFDITINSSDFHKKDINLEITKLLTPFVDMNTYIVYETNIIDIPQITTDYFSINNNNGANCLFKKSNENKNDKLFLFCVAENSGEYSLGKINELILDNINILYNFKITEKENRENFAVSEYKSSIIYSVYPEEIDFNKQDSFIIRYETDYPERLNGIKLNNDSSFELECFNRIRIKECYVNQTHFDESGEYYTYYQTSFGYESISLETQKIKVILYEPEPEVEEESENEIEYEKETENENEKEIEKEKEKENEHETEKETKPLPTDSTEPKKLSNAALAGIIIGSVAGGLIIIGLITFFVLRWKKKRFENELSNKIELIGDISYPSG